ncbi:MAG TPA: MarR family transcriptional regulator [Acidimicrobiales bacterium]
MHFDDAQYERLLGFRDGLRRFLRWSDDQAKAAGITPAQHQLLLAVRGHRGQPTIGDLAQHLLLRHHSTVELIDRAERADLVRRDPDPDDHRVVHVHLTDTGEERLAALTAAHIEELARLAPNIEPIWAGLG